MTKDITNDNLVNWLTEFEAINNVSLKIKTKKKQTAGYVLQNYYRCHLQLLVFSVTPFKIDQNKK